MLPIIFHFETILINLIWKPLGLSTDERKLMELRSCKISDFNFTESSHFQVLRTSPYHMQRLLDMGMSAAFKAMRFSLENLQVWPSPMASIDWRVPCWRWRKRRGMLPGRWKFKWEEKGRTPRIPWLNSRESLGLATIQYSWIIEDVYLD